MIIDVHSHAWQYPAHFDDEFHRQVMLARGGVEVDVTVAYEADAAAPRDRALGLLSVAPTQPDWQDELRRGHRQLGLVGMKPLPMYAGFNHHGKRLDPLGRAIDALIHRDALQLLSPPNPSAAGVSP